MTARTPLWAAIASSLRADIAQGRYDAGDKLPTEAALAARFGVNRHTVRHAIATLADSGLVHTRRGAGVFVLARPTDYPLGRRVRFHQNVLAAGQVPERKVLAVARHAAAARDAKALGIAPGAEVISYDAISLASGRPLALAHSLFPAAMLPGLAQELRRATGITKALAACGVADYTRRSTRLTAVAADATQALHLRLEEGAPLLHSLAVNVDATGRVVEYGQTWFAGDRVTLTLEANDA